MQNERPAEDEWDDQTAPSISRQMASPDRPKAVDVAYSPASTEPVRHSLQHERTLSIGRNGSADIRLNDAGVSRVHARIECDALGNSRIVDAGSSNGTFVNRRRVGTAPLQSGDVIRVGKSLLIYDEEHQLGTVRALADQSARTQLPLLLTGSTGAGKEVLARRIHRESGRTGPFLTVNCAAIGDTIGEAELFGYVRGAFTGANSDRAGLIAGAQGGTLLLDEIAELPRVFQAKLLRALESKKVRPLGSNRELPIDVRFLAATNVRLSDQIQQDLFRLDLFMRFAKPVLHLPPLRQRRATLPQLIRELADELALPIDACLTVDTLEIMLLHPWPGNVRELKHVLVALATAGPGRTLDLGFLREHLAGADAALGELSGQPANDPRESVVPQVPSGSNRPAVAKPRPKPRPLRSLSPVDSVAAVQLARALQSTDGNVVQAADALGISRRHVYRLLRRHALAVSEFRARARGI